MSRWKHICLDVKKRLKKKESKNSIGRSYGVSAAEISRIFDEVYPGPKVAKRLGIPEICPFCDRRILPPRIKKESSQIPNHQIWWSNLSKMEKDRLILSLFCEINQG